MCEAALAACIHETSAITVLANPSLSLLSTESQCTLCGEPEGEYLASALVGRAPYCLVYWIDRDKLLQWMHSTVLRLNINSLWLLVGNEGDTEQNS